MTVLLIAAFNDKGYIGKNGKLMYKLKDDLRRFKELTKDHLLIMGRKTFESLPRVLPDRDHHVITSNPSAIKLPKMTEDDVVEYHSSFDEALQDCRSILKAEPSLKGIAICGGEEVFRKGLMVADKLALTVINDDAIGDVSFPMSDLNNLFLRRKGSCVASVPISEGGVTYGYFDHVFNKVTPEEAASLYVGKLGDRLVTIKGETIRLSSIDAVKVLGEVFLNVIVNGNVARFRFSSKDERDGVKAALDTYLANAD